MMEKPGRVLNYKRIVGIIILNQGLIILISKNARVADRHFRRSRIRASEVIPCDV